MPAENFSTILGIGILLLQVKILYLILHLVAPKNIPIPNFAKKNYLLGIFLVSFLAMVGSLVYSEVVKFPPCSLCWYQRIAIYSITVVSLVALLRKYSKEVVVYVQTLSIAGIFIATLHVISEQTGTALVCGSGGVSCAKQLVFALGYISIPIMSLTVLVLIFLLTFIRKKG